MKSLTHLADASPLPKNQRTTKEVVQFSNAWNNQPVQIRARGSADIQPLCALIEEVHALDGYPVLLHGNPEDFLITTNSYAAWVAELRGVVCGHISLHTVWSDAVAALVCARLACDRAELGAVSRLFVQPSARGSGIGRALLNTAAAEASRRGLVPVLDVVTTYHAAIALYEDSGWTRLGAAGVEMPNGDPIEEFVYTLP